MSRVRHSDHNSHGLNGHNLANAFFGWAITPFSNLQWIQQQTRGSFGVYLRGKGRKGLQGYLTFPDTTKTCSYRQSILKVKFLLSPKMMQYATQSSSQEFGELFSAHHVFPNFSTLLLCNPWVNFRAVPADPSYASKSTTGSLKPIIFSSLKMSQRSLLQEDLQCISRWPPNGS